MNRVLTLVRLSVVAALLMVLLPLVSRVAHASEFLLNPGLAGTSSWTSAAGWQSCDASTGLAPCNDGNNVIFSRAGNAISQCVNISDITSYTGVTATASGAQYQGTNATDVLLVTLLLYGSNGCVGKMYQNGPPVNLTSAAYVDVSVSLTSAYASWSSIRSIMIHVKGTAGEATDGNLGPIVRSASLDLAGGPGTTTTVAPSTTTTTTVAPSTTTTTTTVAPSTTTTSTTSTLAPSTTTTTAPVVQSQTSTPTGVSTPVGTTPTTNSPDNSASVSSSTTVQTPQLTEGGTAASSTVAPSQVSRGAGASTTTTVATTEGASAPSAPQVGTGDGAVLVDGATVDSTTSREDNQIVVQAGLTRVMFGVVNDAGEVLPLDSDGGLALVAGTSVRVRAWGFMPESTIEGWMFSVPVMLFSATAQNNGSVDHTFRVPDKAQVGSHRIAVSATGTDRDRTVVAIGVRIGEFEPESNIATRIIVVALLLAGGLAVVLPAVSRRQRKSA